MDATDDERAGRSPRLPDVVTPAFIEQILDYAIIALDADGTIRSWNAGAEKLKGYTAHDALGQNFSIFYPPEDRDAGLPQDLLQQARTHGRVEHTGWRMRQDGTRFWGDVVITALHDDTGTVTGYAKVTRDLTEQHRLEQALRESEARFRLLVSEVVDYAIIALDADGTIRSWNAGAEKLKGYTAHDALGQNFSIFYPPEDRDAGLPQDLLQQARTHGRVEHTGWRVRQDGTRFWGDVVITALHDDTGTVTGYAKVTRDLTEQHRLEQARASLFAAVSHDLRSPVVAIGAYAALISDAGHATRREYAERIVENAEQVEHLVADLFDYARLSASGSSTALRPTPLTPLVRAAVADRAAALDGRDVTVEADERAVARADRSDVVRVLDNLLTNAVRYSPVGSPISVTVARHGKAVRFSVADRGRGIAPEDLPTIFDEFVRGRLASDDDGGTGLGLASVRALVARQDGRVWIDSELGAGTTVTVELPSATPDE